MLAELKSYYDLKNDKGLQIIFVNENSHPKTFLYNDPVRFRQIMTNLLNNACKYTEAGSIRFGYRMSENQIRFFVEDTGIGISEVNKTKVFNHFHKIEPYADRFHQGTGIGLSISKRLVNMMGGEIEVESELNKGSVFSFVLPISNSANRAGDRLTDTSSGKTINHLKKITVVVAEDEPDNYKLIEKMLKKTEATIIWARNGQEAVDYFRDTVSDNNCIVLMDIKMPVMNGLEACGKIKEMNSRIPVIAVTAYAQAGEREIIMKSGFDDFITKPLNFETLWKSISQLIGHA